MIFCHPNLVHLPGCVAHTATSNQLFEIGVAMKNWMLWILWAAVLLLNAVAAVLQEAYATNNHHAANSGGSADSEIINTHVISGSILGGTGVVLVGGGNINSIIDGELACVFGSNINGGTDTGWANTAAQWISPTEIGCITSEWDVAGVNVSLV